MLKKRLTFATIFAHFDAPFSFIFEIDASNYAMGAIYTRTQKNGQVYSVAFLSQKFSAVEINYNIHDKEMVAIVFTFQVWIH